MRRSMGSLILKLSGTILGLVVLMMASSYIGPMIGTGQISQDKILEKYALFNAPALPARPVLPSVEYSYVTPVVDVLELKENVNVIVEEALESASESLRAFEAEQFELVLEEHEAKLEALEDVLENISEVNYIPSSLRLEMSSEVQSEIKKAAVELKMMKRGLLKTVVAELEEKRLAYSSITPKLKKQGCEDQKLEFIESPVKLRSLKRRGNPHTDNKALSWI